MAHHSDEYKEKQGLKFSLLYLFWKTVSDQASTSTATPFTVFMILLATL